MSLFLIPTLDATDMAQPCQRRTVTRGNSCGAPAVRSPFDLLFGGGDHSFVRHAFAAAADDEETHFAAYEARLRHQQRLEEQRLQERYAALRRQAEIERERERRRIRAQQEQQQRRQAALAAAAAAHAAWQQEPKRLVRAALERQQRRQHEALAAAERQRAWQQQQQQHRLAEAAAAARTQRQHGYDEQVAAAVAQEQWEELAKQGLSVAFEFAKNLFGLEENDDDDDEMQVDDQRGKSNEAGPSNLPATEVVATEKKEEVADKDIISFEDPPEVAPAQTEELLLTQTQQDAEQPQPQQMLVFTHPLPSDAAQRAAIKADDIQVQYDDQSQSIVIRGLWQGSHIEKDTASSDGQTAISSSSSSSSDDEEHSRGRKRSRSPKRSRVSDVDEQTGEEIVQTDDSTAVDADGFVKVTTKGKQAQGSARITVPHGANVAGLRAELTDDGFQVWL